MRERTISAHNLAQLLGKMNSTVCVIPHTPLIYLYLQMALSNTLERNNHNYEALTTYQQNASMNWTGGTPTCTNGMAGFS